MTTPNVSEIETIAGQRPMSAVEMDWPQTANRTVRAATRRGRNRSGAPGFARTPDVEEVAPYSLFESAGFGSHLK